MHHVVSPTVTYLSLQPVKTQNYVIHSLLSNWVSVALIILYVNFVPEVAGQAEHEPPDKASDPRIQGIAQEWVHHQAVLMEKAHGIISEICSKSEGEFCGFVITS